MLETIVLDCDGVILDWHLGFYDWMRAQGHEVAHPYPAEYAMTSSYPGKTKDEIFAHIPTFNVSPDFGRLAQCHGAFAGVLALKIAFPAARVVVLSAVGDAPETHQMRRDNLAELPIDEIVLVPHGVSKRPWLEKMAKPAVLVEDHPGHAAAAAELGFTAVLIDRPWNRDESPKGVHRVRSWADVYSTVIRHHTARAA